MSDRSPSNGAVSLLIIRIQSNQELQESFVQQEKDSVYLIDYNSKFEVIAALQAENEVKNLEIKKLGDQIEDLKLKFKIKEAELKETNEKKIQGD